MRASPLREGTLGGGGRLRSGSALLGPTAAVGLDLLLANGCTRANPVFDDTEADPTVGSETASASSTAVPPASSGDIPDGTSAGSTSRGDPPIDSFRVSTP